MTNSALKLIRGNAEFPIPKTHSGFAHRTTSSSGSVKTDCYFSHLNEVKHVSGIHLLDIPAQIHRCTVTGKAWSPFPNWERCRCNYSLFLPKPLAVTSPATAVETSLDGSRFAERVILRVSPLTRYLSFLLKKGNT
ncbi:hypothetical protein VTO42DRAFT_4954 [Malbranchea cinnamomea]